MSAAAKASGLSEPFDAIVLAGGAGSRLGGTDKAAVELADEPLIARALRACEAAERLVVVGATSAPLPRRVVLTREEPAGSGPAAALVAGMRELPAGGAAWVALLACDLPDAEAALERVRSAAFAPTAPPEATGRDGAVLTDPDGRPQWVAATFRRSALVAAIADFGDPANRSLRSLLGGLDLTRVPPAGTEWHDVDSWEDHALWRERLGARAAYADAPRPTEMTEDGHMTDLKEPREDWDRWIAQACEALGVRPEDVDIAAIHELTRKVAHNLERPLAPVSAFIVALAIGEARGRGESLDDATRDALYARIPVPDKAPGDNVPTSTSNE